MALGTWVFSHMSTTPLHTPNLYYKKHRVGYQGTMSPVLADDEKKQLPYGVKIKKTKP